MKERELDNTDVETICVMFTHRHSKASIHADVKIPCCHRNSSSPFLFCVSKMQKGFTGFHPDYDLPYTVYQHYHPPSLSAY